MKAYVLEKCALFLPKYRKRHLYMENGGNHKKTESLKLLLHSLTHRFFSFLRTQPIYSSQPILSSYKKSKQRGIAIRKSLTSTCFEPQQLNPHQVCHVYCQILTNAFLKLAANSEQDVNQERDEEGMAYGRKLMMQCGLAKQKINCGRYDNSSHICRRFSGSIK